jgi:hypothetical protein
LGRAPGEILEVAGHAHLKWPLAPWDSCSLETCTPPFRPLWLAHRSRRGRWSIRLIGPAAQPRQRRLGMPNEAVVAWARMLTRRFRHQLKGPAASTFEQYRAAARAML